MDKKCKFGILIWEGLMVKYHWSDEKWHLHQLLLLLLFFVVVVFGIGGDRTLNILFGDNRFYQLS